MEQEKPTEKIKGIIKDLYFKGVKINDIVTVSNLKRSVVTAIIYQDRRKEYYHIKKYGMGTNLTYDLRQRIHQMYRFGHAVSTISDRLQIPNKLVQRQITKIRSEQKK